MSYGGIEESTFNGLPVELFLIETGLARWRYTNANEPVNTETATFTPIAVKRDTISISGSFDKQDITIKLPRDADVGSIWRAAAPSDIVQLTIFRRHMSGGTTDYITAWTGRVLNAKFDEVELTLTAESLFTSMKRNGLMRKYSLQCQYSLYDAGCRLSTLAWEVPTIANVASGNTLTVNAAGGYGDDYFSGGYVTWQHNSTSAIEKRFVVSHTGQTLVLDAVIDGLVSGDNISLFPGCDKTKSTCINKFDNVLNYGGFPYIPARNPYDGINTPVF